MTTKLSPRRSRPRPRPAKKPSTHRRNRKPRPPHHSIYYRFVARKQFGATVGSRAPEIHAAQGPTIEGVSTSDVTATSADLNARIDPDGFATHLPLRIRPHHRLRPDRPPARSCEITGDAEELSGRPRSSRLKIAGLQAGVTYHFRVVARKRVGTPSPPKTRASNSSPPCPNSAVRQQTGSDFLPDCRAYELVSPANANATLLRPGGPNTGLATSPSRFSSPALRRHPRRQHHRHRGDLYVATRTDTGWVTHYVGLPGNEAGCSAAPPPTLLLRAVGNLTAVLTNSVFTDPSMSRFADFVDGAPVNCYSASTSRRHRQSWPPLQRPLPLQLPTVISKAASHRSHCPPRRPRRP